MGTARTTKGVLEAIRRLVRGKIERGWVVDLDITRI